jgi:hypothetical protein
MGYHIADAVDRVPKHYRILQSQDERTAETIGAVSNKGIQRLCRGLFERDVVTNLHYYLLQIIGSICYKLPIYRISGKCLIPYREDAEGV